MFQTQIVSAFNNFSSAPRRAVFAFEPGLLARRLLPVVAAAAFIAAAATSVPQALAPAAFTSPIIVSDASVTAVRDKAEAMRAKILRQPGVAAVSIIGLRQQGLSVEYTMRRLASFGLTPASLAAALPVDQALSRPGHLVLRPSAAGDLQSVANTQVHAGGQAFRLGDVAMVMRAPLATPVSTMNIEGVPAAQLRVTLAR